MSGDSSGDKPRIFVDEDWKSRVQSEKEKAKQGATNAPASPPAAESPKPAAKPTPPPPQEPQEIPPASFPLLVQMLATPAMMDIEEAGQLQEKGESPAASLARAKHFVDLLGVLEEKTKGNLSPEESRWMSGMLHQLRMFFVQASKG